MFKNVYQLYKYRSISSCITVINGSNMNKYQNVMSTFYKSFHVSPAKEKRVFQDLENQHAHNIILNRLNLVNRMESAINGHISDEEFNSICSESNWPNKNNAELTNSFKNLAIYCKSKEVVISDTRLDHIVDAVCYRCFNFSDDELENVLYYLGAFPETATINDRNFLELWSAFDDACVARLSNWDIDKLLEIADLWYRLHLSKTINFTFYMLRKIERKAKKLTPAQLVRVMFHINLFRKSVIDMMNFELNLSNSIENLNIDEIGIISMGFFKTQTKIVNKALISNIYHKTMMEVESINDITFVSVLKNLRYSSSLEHVDILYALLDRVAPHIEKYSLLTCIHIALLGSDMQICHQKTIEAIINKFLSVYTSARLKDLERISFIIGLYDFKMESNNEQVLCENIMKDIPNRVKEIMRHPRCLASCVHYLTQKGISSNEIISNILDPKFIATAYGRNMLSGREIYQLDAYTRINLHSKYDGHQLSLKQRKTIAGLIQNSTDPSMYKVSATSRLINDVANHCKDIYKSILPAFILPHYDRHDILLAFDMSSKTPISLTHLNSKVQSHYAEVLESNIFLNEIDHTNVRLISIVVGGWNNFVRGQNNRCTGHLKLKLEQLSLLGYYPVLISWFEWNPLAALEKNKFLQNKVNSRLLEN